MELQAESSENSTLPSTESSEVCDIFRLTACNWESTIKNVFWKRMIEFRDKINKIFDLLLKIDNDMKRIAVEADLHQKDIEKNMASITSRKKEIEIDTSMDDDERNEKIQSILCEFEQNTSCFKNAFECLKKEKCEKLGNAKVLFDELFVLKDGFKKTHTENMEEIRKFEWDACKALKPEVRTKMNILRHNYEKIYSHIYNTEFELKFLRKTVEEKVENAVVCSSSTSTSDSEVPFISELHELRNIEIQKRQQNIAYIKKHIGKPLMEALSSIKIYEPLDPLNYISNYLFYYRHNELTVQKKRTKIEELLSQKSNRFENCDDINVTAAQRFCP